MTKVLTVVGKGKLKCKPDCLRIQLHLRCEKKKYEDAVKELKEYTLALQACLKESGYAKEEVKTSHYSVQSHYESKQTKTGNWVNRLVGYQGFQDLSIELDNKEEELNRFLQTIAIAKIPVEFSLHYGLKNPEEGKKKVLYAAVRDARTKAKILTEASGVLLGEIQKIEYGTQDMLFERSIVNGMALKESIAYEESADSLALTPVDIQVEDTVTILWEIH
ncbi:MAG: SIMPL domain-containing protein [Solobacterium sp.]|nr:SIMPL domain-containing protein [Solobacterium sp.]